MYQYIDGDYVHGPDIYLDDCYMDERWWYIDGAPGYMISDKGRVWSIKSQQFIKPKPMDRKGHLGVCLSVDGEPRYYYVHRLMAKAFIPNPDNYPIVRHLNDVKYDNSLENLAWGTKKDNALDAIRNGISYTPTKEDIEKMSLDEYKMEVAKYYMMFYTKSMDDEYLKRFIIWYGESLEEFYYDKTLPVGAAFFIAMGFH